ncbi:MAG: hypothetical protein ABIP94_16055, partial [Planctomycetota bacterium]
VVLLSQAAQGRGDTARTQAIAGGALLALGLLTSTSADVRHWPTLPSSVQALTAQVPSGQHSVQVEFLDARGRPLPTMTQQVVVTVPEKGEAWVLFRSLPAAPRVEGPPDEAAASRGLGADL